MKHKFRAPTINAELELVAKEFEEAPPLQKNDRAEYLFLFMENYPNAELERALPVVERNFLDAALESQIRRKCAKMLGEICARCKNAKATAEITGLLRAGIGSRDCEMAKECIRAAKKIASARKFHDFDSLIVPILERILREITPADNPELIEMALSALEKIKPKMPESLDRIDDVHSVLSGRRSMANPGSSILWDSTMRRLEKIRSGWSEELIRQGKWGPKKIEIPAPAGTRQGNNGAANGTRRKIILP